jgi:hypothetical protein
MSSASMPSPPEESSSNVNSNGNNDNNKGNNIINNKRMDINEFLSAMLYRTRKGEYK